MEDIEIIAQLTEIDARSRSNTKRIDRLTERQDNLEKLVTSVEVLATKMDGVIVTVKETKEKVDELSAKPGRKWDGLAEKVVWAVVAAIIAFCLAQIGL